jgi:hypothetical protein
LADITEDALAELEEIRSYRG